MSDNEDNTPPESLFFMRRAEFVPKVSAEEFKNVSALLNKNDSNNILVGKTAVKSSSSSAVKKFKSNNGTKKKSSAETEEILDENSLSNQAVLSAAAKRRLKKQQEELASELRLIKAANKQVIAAAEEPSVTEVEEILVDKSENNTSTILTISYMSEIARLRCYENEKFAVIFPKVAEMFKLKASEILLCLGEQNIKVDDTPKSLNITLADTIECIPCKADESGETHTDDKIKLYFQSNDSKEKIDFLVHKLQKLEEIMDKYSKLRTIPLEQLIFEFDGERIQGTETPEDLDMESGNCIDVRIISQTPIEETTTGTPPKKTKPETPTKKTTGETPTRRSTRSTTRGTTRNTTNTTRRTTRNTNNTTRRSKRTTKRATARRARGTRRSPRIKDTVVVLDDESNSSIVLDDVSNSSIVLDDASNSSILLDDDSNNSSILLCD